MSDYTFLWNYYIWHADKTLYFSIIQCFDIGMRTNIKSVDDEAWNEAERLTNALRPLLTYERIPEFIKFSICHELKISESKFYRELKKLRKSPLVTSILPKRRGPLPGNYLLSADVESLLQTCIRKHYLKRPKPTVSSFYRIVRAEFLRNKIPKPSSVTVWRRIQDIPKKKRQRCHEGASMQNSQNARATTHFTTERPMQIVA